MKMIKKPWALLFVFWALLSCSASQTKPTANASEDMDLIVTFFSTGSGIDRKTYPEFKDFLTTNYPNLTFLEQRYGREGETQFCFDLSSFKKDDKNKFLTEAKAILSKSEIVRIQENSPCVYKKN